MKAGEVADRDGARPARAGGRGKHLFAALRRRAHVQTRRRVQVVFGRVCDVLLPWSATSYPGQERGVSAALDGRAGRTTIVDWRIGRRRAPLWAWQLLCSALDRRIAELEHARALARAEIERLETAGKER